MSMVTNQLYVSGLCRAGISTLMYGLFPYTQAGQLYPSTKSLMIYFTAHDVLCGVASDHVTYTCVVDVHEIVSAPVAQKLILSQLMALALYVVPLITIGNMIVVYQPVVHSRSSSLKCPVNCPDNILLVPATHVLPMKYPTGAYGVGLRISTIFVLPVFALIPYIFLTYPV